jgi:hypothetical protein
LRFLEARFGPTENPTAGPIRVQQPSERSLADVRRADGAAFDETRGASGAA